MNIGVIGYGYWGPNITRNFVELEGCKVSAVCDNRPERLALMQSRFAGVRPETDPLSLIYDPQIDAIAIVSPVSTHFEFARLALENGKHVLVEKPLTTSVSEANILIELAERNNRVLMVDHTFLYTGAVEKMKELIDNDVIGNIKYIDSTRINLGIFQQDVNVLWDLAAHDISVVHHLLGESPYSVQAIGASHTANGIENIAYLILHYESGLIAHFNCSWTSPVKIRQMLIGGDKKMIVFNDIEPTEKIKLYDSGYTVSSDEDKRKILVDYRVGDVVIPKIHTREALAGMARDFYNAIHQGSQPRSGWESGLEVTRILELADESLSKNGKEIICGKLPAF